MAHYKAENSRLLEKAAQARADHKHCNTRYQDLEHVWKATKDLCKDVEKERSIRGFLDQNGSITCHCWIDWLVEIVCSKIYWREINGCILVNLNTVLKSRVFKRRMQK